MINENASNWVDRGEASEPKIAKTLRHFLGFEAELDESWLLQRASILVGMVAADASEVQVASYLGSVQEELGAERSPARQRRVTVIAIWHTAKAAETRDRAVRLLSNESADPVAEHRRLSEMAGRADRAWAPLSNCATRPNCRRARDAELLMISGAFRGDAAEAPHP